MKKDSSAEVVLFNKSVAVSCVPALVFLFVSYVIICNFCEDLFLRQQCVCLPIKISDVSGVLLCWEY